MPVFVSDHPVLKQKLTLLRNKKTDSKTFRDVLNEITTFLGSKGLNISQQINTSRGDIAYTVIDFTNQPEDAEALQQELAEACSYIISLRFLGMVFDDALGEPGTYFYVSWAQ